MCEVLIYRTMICLYSRILSAAHGYYAKFDVGPALLMLLSDSFDIYLSSFDTAVSGLSSSSETTSDVIRHARERDLVSNLLGGAYHACLESKCAFTAAVLDRHGSVIGEMAIRVTQRLATLLLRILQCDSRKVFQAVVYGLHTSSSAESDATNSLRVLYRELLQQHKIMPSASGTPIKCNSSSRFSSIASDC
jgi:uncharacterized protein GlcG (DUF336 family)